MKLEVSFYWLHLCFATKCSNASICDMRKKESALQETKQMIQILVMADSQVMYVQSSH